MAGPAYYSGVINIASNEDWVVPFLFGTVDESQVFTPIDLTGSVIKMEIRRREAESMVMVSVFSPDNGIIIEDAAGGAFTIFIDRARLVQLVPGEYVSDIVREVTATGIQERLWEGTATVVKGTTR